MAFYFKKKWFKTLQQTGHKNYASTLANFIMIVLGHRNPQVAHRYMQNMFAGRPGQGNKMGRDQTVEHVNRFEKTAFNALGSNLNEANATRINNAAEFGMILSEKVTDYFNLEKKSKSRKFKDRTQQVEKIRSVFENENVGLYFPKRSFRGPNVEADFFGSFDEASFREWYKQKEKEMHQKSARYRNKDT